MPAHPTSTALRDTAPCHATGPRPPCRGWSPMSTPHEPVLTERVVDLLAVEDGLIVDATVGAGGHAHAVLAASGPDTELLGLDRDAEVLGHAAGRLAWAGARVHLVHAAYDTLEEVVRTHGRDRPVRSVLYDLGVSSLQLDRAERGFSLRLDAPLDMRMDPQSGPTAAELLATSDETALTTLLITGGEDRHARRIARAILAARPLTTTTELADVVAAAVPAARRTGRTHPATRTFQAIRIAVNAELERFSASLPQALGLLEPAAPPRRGGRVAVLAYHSGEDRIAKRLLGGAARGCICPPDLPVCGCGRSRALRLLTRGAERPSDVEVSRNPRARSARLRAAERTAGALPPDDPIPIDP